MLSKEDISTCLPLKEYGISSIWKNMGKSEFSIFFLKIFIINVNFITKKIINIIYVKKNAKWFVHFREI